MIVISDTTPIISLLKIEKLDILEKLFQKIIIPDAVYKELTDNRQFQEEADIVRESQFIQRKMVQDEKSVHILQRAAGLDLGESEAIIFADEARADWLLMDEIKGRQVAKNMGIRITGTIGIILMAYEESIITREEAKQSIQGLRMASRHIGEDILRYAVKIIEKK